MPESCQDCKHKASTFCRIKHPAGRLNEGCIHHELPKPVAFKFFFPFQTYKAWEEWVYLNSHATKCCGTCKNRRLVAPCGNGVAQEKCIILDAATPAYLNCIYYNK